MLVEELGKQIHFSSFSHWSQSRGVFSGSENPLEFHTTACCLGQKVSPSWEQGWAWQSFVHTGAPGAQERVPIVGRCILVFLCWPHMKWWVPTTHRKLRASSWAACCSLPFLIVPNQSLFSPLHLPHFLLEGEIVGLEFLTFACMCVIMAAPGF